MWLRPPPPRPPRLVAVVLLRARSALESRLLARLRAATASSPASAPSSPASTLSTAVRPRPPPPPPSTPGRGGAAPGVQRTREPTTAGGGHRTGLLPHGTSLQEIAVNLDGLDEVSLFTAPPAWNLLELSKPTKQCFLFDYYGIFQVKALLWISLYMDRLWPCWICFVRTCLCRIGGILSNYQPLISILLLWLLSWQVSLKRCHEFLCLFAYEGGGEMDVDMAAPAAQVSIKHGLPEIEIYCYLLVLIFLIDHKKYDEDKAYACTSIACLKNLNGRTVDVLASRLYSYYAYVHEITNSLAEIRGTLLVLHRMATLHRDELG